MAAITTSTTWSAPGTYTTARPYTLGAMYSPYLAGAEMWVASRASSTTSTVTVTCTYGYGFGTGSNSSSSTGYTVTATISGGMSASATISSGTWKRTGSTAKTLVSGISQTGYETLKTGTISKSISNWTSGSKTFTMTITQASGESTSHTVTLTCPAYSSTISINYNKNGGSGTMAPTTYTYASSGVTSLRPNTFTRSGYYFYGWHRTQAQATAGNREYTDAQNWNLNNAGPTYELYAAWRPNTYTVFYRANGGIGTMEPSSITYNTNFLTRPNAFTRLGYSFNGWKSKLSEDGEYTGESWGLNSSGVYESGKGPWNWTYTADRYLYAQWLNNVYTISLNNNEATTSYTSVYYQKYEDGIYSDSSCENLLTHITPPEKTGCTFVGYFTALNGGELIIDSSGNFISSITTKFTSNTTLYARWEERTCTVNFYYLNTAGGIHSVQYQVGILSSGKLAPSLALPNYSSYEFSGYWQLLNGPATQCQRTDLVYDNYVAPYNKTNYVPYGSGGSEQLSPNGTLYYAAVYKRRLSTLTTTSYNNQYKVIRYTPIPGQTDFNTLTNEIQDDLNVIDDVNNDNGTSIFGVLQFVCGLNYATTTLYKLGNPTPVEITKVGLNNIRNSTSFLDIPELTDLSTHQIHTTTKLVKNITYVIFQIDSIDAASNYTINLNFGNIVTNDFNVPVTFSAKLISQGMNFILDINKTGTMWSMGGIAYDDLSNEYIRKYTPTPETSAIAEYYGSNEDNHREEASRITALYNAIYVANAPAGISGNDKKLIPALTEGRVEDEVIMTPPTLQNWDTILSGGQVSPSSVVVAPLSVTRNGTYTAPNGMAYSPVSVAVEGGGGGSQASYSNGILIIS